jgi:hypothetical protein
LEECVRKRLAVNACVVKKKKKKKTSARRQGWGDLFLSAL